MPRGPRRSSPVIVSSDDEQTRHARTERRLGRKVDRMIASSHGGYAGPSILETLEDHLLKACKRHVAVTTITPANHGKIGVAQIRGTIRGLAQAVAVMRNPYAADIDTVSRIEREFIRKAYHKGY
jgi:hypothetical protein